MASPSSFHSTRGSPLSRKPLGPGSGFFGSFRSRKGAETGLSQIELVKAYEVYQKASLAGGIKDDWKLSCELGKLGHSVTGTEAAELHVGTWGEAGLSFEEFCRAAAGAKMYFEDRRKGASDAQALKDAHEALRERALMAHQLSPLRGGTVASDPGDVAFSPTALDQALSEFGVSAGSAEDKARQDDSMSFEGLATMMVGGRKGMFESTIQQFERSLKLPVHHPAGIGSPQYPDYLYVVLRKGFRVRSQGIRAARSRRLLDGGSEDQEALKGQGQGGADAVRSMRTQPPPKHLQEAIESERQRKAGQRRKMRPDSDAWQASWLLAERIRNRSGERAGQRQQLPKRPSSTPPPNMKSPAQVPMDLSQTVMSGLSRTWFMPRASEPSPHPSLGCRSESRGRRSPGTPADSCMPQFPYTSVVSQGKFFTSPRKGDLDSMDRSPTGASVITAVMSPILPAAAKPTSVTPPTKASARAKVEERAALMVQEMGKEMASSILCGQANPYCETCAVRPPPEAPAPRLPSPARPLPPGRQGATARPPWRKKEAGCDVSTDGSRLSLAEGSRPGASGYGAAPRRPVTWSFRILCPPGSSGDSDLTVGLSSTCFPPGTDLRRSAAWALHSWRLGSYGEAWLWCNGVKVQSAPTLAANSLVTVALYDSGRLGISVDGNEVCSQDDAVDWGKGTRLRPCAQLYTTGASVALRPEYGAQGPPPKPPTTVGVAPRLRVEQRSIRSAGDAEEVEAIERGTAALLSYLPSAHIEEERKLTDEEIFATRGRARRRQKLFIESNQPALPFEEAAFNRTDTPEGAQPMAVLAPNPHSQRKRLREDAARKGRLLLAAGHALNNPNSLFARLLARVEAPGPGPSP
eukprot:Hpha_TRINITY_DN4995_c1_g1::TRINITY_DN4995_c1_g1_i1::g.51505::m.51505